MKGERREAPGRRYRSGAGDTLTKIIDQEGFSAGRLQEILHDLIRCSLAAVAKGDDEQLLDWRNNAPRKDSKLVASCPRP